MSNKSKPRAHLYQIDLPVLDDDGNPADAATIKQILEEYDVFESLEAGEKMPEGMVKRMNARGTMLDVKKTLLGIVKQPKGQGGMNFDDLDQVKPLVTLLKEADTGTAVYLEEGDYKILRERTKDYKGWSGYRDSVLVLRDNIMNAKKVPFEIAKPEADEDVTDSANHKE